MKVRQLHIGSAGHELYRRQRVKMDKEQGPERVKAFALACSATGDLRMLVSVEHAAITQHFRVCRAGVPTALELEIEIATCG